MLLLSESRDEYAMRRCGELLDASGAQAKDRFWSTELRFWDYVLRGMALSLCWEQDTGLSLLAGDKKPETERQLHEVAKALRSELARTPLDAT